MNDHDDARDLRAALGGLLVDEPTAPWSAQDDVARGRALQHRRRTRTLGGIGLVAALALVLGTLGPWRPFAAPVQPADQPPVVDGVSQEWLRSLSDAFFENLVVAVDWSQSTVAVEDGGGFSLDLALVPGIVTDEAGDRVEADPTEVLDPVTRALVHWSPAGGAGPVLTACRQPECARIPDGVFPGFEEAGGRWTTAGAQRQDTYVLDRTFTEGGTLEIATVPLQPADEESSGGVITHGFIRLVQDAVGRPGSADPAAPDLATAVTDELEALGWVTVAVAGPDTEPGSPEVKTWNVGRADSGGTVKAKLVLRTWDATSFADGPVPQGRALDACIEAAACGTVDLIESDCSAGPCWQRTRAVIQEQFDVLPVGTALAGSWSLSPRVAAEIAVTPPSAEGTAPDPLETAAFLTQSEQNRLLGVVQTWLLAQPAPVPASQPCTSDDVALAVGTDTIDPPDGRAVVLVSVRARDSSVECVLDGFPQVVALGVDGAALPFVPVDEGLDQQVRVTEGAGGIFRVSPRLCAPVGGDVATLRVTLPGGGPAVDLDARVALPLVSCAVGAGAGTDLWVSGFEPSSVDVPSTITACSPGEVKLIPATGAPVAVDGARGGWIEIHARNPEVDCLATAPASVSFADADGTVLTFRYRQGVYQSADLDSSAIEVSQAIGPSRFALTRYRCDSEVLATAATAYVTLEGWDRPVAVQLPPGFGIERCAGGVDDPGNTVYVSNLTSVTPGT